MKILALNNNYQNQNFKGVLPLPDDARTNKACVYELYALQRRLNRLNCSKQNMLNLLSSKNNDSFTLSKEKEYQHDKKFIKYVLDNWIEKEIASCQNSIEILKQKVFK